MINVNELCQLLIQMVLYKTVAFCGKAFTLPDTGRTDFARGHNAEKIQPV